MPAILDTNVLIRHFRQDHPDHSLRASAFMMSILLGDQRADLPVTVLFETSYLLQKSFGLSRLEVVDLLEPLLSMRNLTVADRPTARRTFEIYGQFNVSFADAYHAALAERNNPPQVVSFDRGYDRIKTIERIEP